MEESCLKVIKNKEIGLQTFRAEYAKLLGTSGLKGHWTIGEAEEAVDLCVEDLVGPGDARLENEFLAIEQHHYTSTGRRARR